jgi:hypothetical protein
MPRFVQFLQHSGVYAEQDFMIVPRPGFNLVCLRDSKDVRLSHDNRLQVDVVGFEDVERVALEYINYRYGKKKSQERDDQLLRLRAALFATAPPDSLARGYKVTANGKGVPELTADARQHKRQADRRPSAAQGLQDRVQVPQAARFIGQGDRGHEMEAGGRALDAHPAELDVRRPGEHLFHPGRRLVVHGQESPGTQNHAG